MTADDDLFPPKPEADLPMAVRQAAATWQGDEPVFDGPSAPFLPSVLRRGWHALLRRSAVWVLAIIVNVVWVVASRRLGSVAAAGLVCLIAGVAATTLAFTGRGRRRGHRLSPRRVAAAALAVMMASLILGICFRMVEVVMGSMEAAPAG